jgi:VanZ family protein
MTARRSALPLFAAVALAFVVAYASLEPFAGWQLPPEGSAYFLLNPEIWAHWRAFDLIANIMIYVPLGFALQRLTRALVMPLLMSAALSFALESFQVFLPMRQASGLDWCANTSGALLGIALGTAYERAHALQHYLRHLRERVVPGPRGDYGIAIMAIFLAAHANPGLPLFASTFMLPGSGDTEPGLAMLQGMQSALNVVGVGLFADLLMRDRLRGGRVMVAVLVCAMAIKTITAAFLLRPDAWGEWLRPTVAVGTMVGAIVLLAVFWLTPARKRIICNVCLVVALVIPVLAPDWLFARPPLRAFDWQHGHLLNFNGVTQTLLRVWPLLASAYLLATAGNPDQDGPR